MTLVETLAWAAVELQGAHPDIHAVRVALERALEQAAKLDIKTGIAQSSLIRMAKVAGLDDDISGGEPWTK